MSEKTAAREFGLTHEEVVSAIRAGKLRHVVNYAHGNPYIKLIARRSRRSSVPCVGRQTSRPAS